MRLVNANTLKLEEFFGDAIPRYATLSHTWGHDAEEVTFAELVSDTGQQKKGFKKIQFTGEQAEKDSLKYFWIDTCCIDKSNSVELQEAIISMFRWYRDAIKCYVYLEDVSTAGYDNTDQSLWQPAFRGSRWFTRGWTLQELIAPSRVDFFSSEGQFLGDKKSLERQLHDITGIKIEALQGHDLSTFSIDERLSWAADRETKRAEDKAYSLLGIFDIHMSLRYGEGAERAFRRLKEKIHKRAGMIQADPEDYFASLRPRESDHGELENALSHLNMDLEENERSLPWNLSTALSRAWESRLHLSDSNAELVSSGAYPIQSGQRLMHPDRGVYDSQKLYLILISLQ